MLEKWRSMVKNFREDKNGNILIEISLSLPLLVLLLSAGFDLARHVLLLNKLDQFIAVQARHLTQNATAEEGEINALRLQGLRIMGLKEANTRFFLSAEGGAITADGRYQSDWSVVAPANDIACRLQDRPVIGDLPDPDITFPDYPMIIVSACFDAGADYYLTPILSESLRVLQAQAIDYTKKFRPVGEAG